LNYSPDAVHSMLAAPIVAKPPVEVQGVHNVMVLEQGSVNCRRMLNVAQSLWSERHFPRETDNYGVC
jgi:hypothetical protein